MSNRKPSGWHEKHTGTETDPAAVWVPVAKLKAWAKNPRKNDKAVERVAESIRTFGFGAPLLARKANGELIAGHTRLRAAVSLGLDVVPVRYLDLDESKAHLLALADNKLGEIAQWDDALLGSVLADLKAEGAALETSGFAEHDLRKILESAGADGSGDVDDVHEPPPNPITKPGDIIALGNHRLICGDSTKAETFERLMGDTHADIVFTDPPYGIAYEAMRGGKKIANDGTLDVAEGVLGAALALTADSEAHFVCCDWRSQGMAIAALRSVGIEPKACIVWDKTRRVQNLDRYAKRHEFIVYAGPYGGQPTVADDVWAVDRDFDPDHPTPKPIDLIEQAITTSSSVGAVVYDAFAGSGSTLIACETTGRSARCVELDPAYCDVIIARWEALTGKKAERVDGQLREA